MATGEDLQKVIKEQKAQLINYEKKLKDVVRAYKSIEAEKKALEIAFSALSPYENSNEQGENSADVRKDETKEPPKTTEEQLEALKQAISTLTIENKKKELAFQVDRKSLLATKDRLTEEIDRLKKSAADRDVERKLREKLADVEAQHEKMLSEHGIVVAEMQQRYAKERKHSEKMEKQVTQLSYRLQEKDDIIQTMENRAKEYAKMEQEMQRLRKRAEVNPTTQVLKQELVNVKDRYEEELLSVRNRHTINAALLGEKDSRICALEERIKSITEESASTAIENAELRNKIAELSDQLVKLERLSKSAEVDSATQKSASLKSPKDVQILQTEVRDACRELKARNCGKFLAELVRDLSDCVETNTARKPKRHSNDDSDEEKSEGKDGCDLCNSAQREAANFKTQIRELQRKLQSLEEMHCISKEEHMQTSDALKNRIAELETNQERAYSQLSSECMEKVAEMEKELKRQQIRMREIIAEKDKEIEYARNTLNSLSLKNCALPHASELVGSVAGYATPIDPLDPEPRDFDGNLHDICDLNSPDIESAKEKSKAMGFRRQSTIESRNIFYEEELLRREQEISELRNMTRLSELKVRDIEQAMLTKDIQYLQIVETLKEEIRVLEGKLSIEQSETNLAYLRNIFVQLVNSNSTKSRRHILKAMGAVLKLTSTEMKRIESWNL